MKAACAALTIAARHHFSGYVHLIDTATANEVVMTKYVRLSGRRQTSEHMTPCLK